MREVFIVAAKRTPVGSFGGQFAGISATALGSTAIKAAVEAAGIDPAIVEAVYFGNVVSANLGQAPARQAAIGAGLPVNVQCTTVNKVCASGTKATAFGAQDIMLGYADVVVVGGMESMSNAPYYVPKARFGYKYGDATLVDGLNRDGLEDVYQKKAMGVFADATAAKYNLTREAQDAYAIQSYKRVASATDAGHFSQEIAPVAIPQKKGGTLDITADEEYKNVFFDKIPALKPAFTPNGTVTAANASTINDGAAALVLMSGEKMKALGLKPIAKIIAFADAEHEPEWFTTAPTIALPKALKMAGLTMADIDYFEINEAFAVVPMAFSQILNVPEEKINVYGGAVALGHPLGASGARIITTLTSVLRNNKAKYGAVAICNGGGGASAMIIENLA